jgi:hypothetical protein
MCTVRLGFRNAAGNGGNFVICTARSAELSSAMNPLGISTWGMRIVPSREIVNLTVVEPTTP